MNKLKQIFNFLFAYFNRLNKRERLFILVGIAVGLGVILILAITSPGKKNQGSAKSMDIFSGQEEFYQVVGEYAGLKPVLEKVAGELSNRPQDFDLYRRLNEVVEKLGIRSSLIKMEPGQAQGNEYLAEEYVDLNFQKIDLYRLVNFMKEAEALPGLVRITQFSMKVRIDGSQTMDAVMRISAYQEAGR